LPSSVTTIDGHETASSQANRFASFSVPVLIPPASMMAERWISRDDMRGFVGRAQLAIN
jgi:hypothetical protein